MRADHGRVVRNCLRIAPIVACTAALAAASAGPVDAGSAPFPKTVALPGGFSPEGIAIAPGGRFFVGSISSGAVYSGDVRTGVGAGLVPGRAGRAAIGVDVDRHQRLFVAGGPSGKAFVYDARTGADVATYDLSPPPTFVNDVVITKDAAWLTDSFRAVLYRIPIAADGELGAAAETVPLTGDFELGAGFNANGIDATSSGNTLVVVQSNTGKLFAVDPATGVSREIALTGGDASSGDGILLDGKTLYVVQNFLNRVAVIELEARLRSGAVVGHVTGPGLDIPTTIAEHGNRLYAVNARFTTSPGAGTSYWLTQLRKPPDD